MTRPKTSMSISRNFSIKHAVVLSLRWHFAHQQTSSCWGQEEPPSAAPRAGEGGETLLLHTGEGLSPGPGAHGGLAKLRLLGSCVPVALFGVFRRTWAEHTWCPSSLGWGRALWTLWLLMDAERYPKLRLMAMGFLFCEDIQDFYFFQAYFLIKKTHQI